MRYGYWFLAATECETLQTKEQLVRFLFYTNASTLSANNQVLDNETFPTKQKVYDRYGRYVIGNKKAASKNAKNGNKTSNGQLIAKKEENSGNPPNIGKLEWLIILWTW